MGSQRVGHDWTHTHRGRGGGRDEKTCFSFFFFKKSQLRNSLIYGKICILKFKAQGCSNKFDLKRSPIRHLILHLSKIKAKYWNLKVTRWQKLAVYKGILIRLSVYSQQKLYRPRKNVMIHQKYWKEKSCQPKIQTFFRICGKLVSGLSSLPLSGYQNLHILKYLYKMV